MNEQLIIKQNRRLVENLKPQSVFEHFLTLCHTPRGTGNEAEIAGIITKLAKDNNMTSYRDDLDNVLVHVPASPGYEHYPLVCLQSHLDMVCKSKKDIGTMFPIELVLDGNKLKAKSSSLGGDNGFGVAPMMALISEPSINHGPLELLFTTVEEDGMDGVKAFDFSRLKSKYLINLDSEERDTIFVGCAGGVRKKIVVPVKFEYPNKEKTFTKLRIKVLKLTGGHSGLDIHLGRANAIKIISRILLQVSELINVYLLDFIGGDKMNIIADNSEVVVLVPADKANEFVLFCQKLEEDIQKEFPKEVIEIDVSESNSTAADMVMTADSQANLLKVIMALPDGAMSMEPLSLDQTRTSNNVGVVVTEADHTTIEVLLRSSLTSQMRYVEAMIDSICDLAGAKVEKIEEFPPWSPNFISKLLAVAKKSHFNVTQEEPNVKSIHAGLEPAVVDEELPEMEKVSIGPTLGDVHGVNEWADTESVHEFWKRLLHLLISINQVNE